VVAAIVVLAAGLVGGVAAFNKPAGTTALLRPPNGGPVCGSVHLHRTASGFEVDMDLSGVAPNPPGSTYECWFVGPSDSVQHPNRVSAGTFRVDADARASLRMMTSADLKRFPIIGITLETDGGNPARHGVKVLGWWGSGWMS